MAEIYSLLPGALRQAGSLVRLLFSLLLLRDGILRPQNKRNGHTNSPLKDGGRKAIGHEDLMALVTGYHNLPDYNKLGPEGK